MAKEPLRTHRFLEHLPCRESGTIMQTFGAFEPMAIDYLDYIYEEYAHLGEIFMMKETHKIDYDNITMSMEITVAILAGEESGICGTDITYYNHRPRIADIRASLLDALDDLMTTADENRDRAIGLCEIIEEEKANAKAHR